MEKIDFIKFKIFFKKFLRFLVKKGVLVLLFLFFLSFVISGLVFYKYVYSLKNLNLESTTKQLRLDQPGYQKMLKFWSERKENFDAADTKVFKDPF